ncbi:MAG: hypothetical protein CO118_00085 [Flavobacteriales bacterium CG_4_9_14_3_um_filter_32_8]|nr:MAG: hypothetical protein CO118_00085 [Flavobacteriales bacterium CG_4_9_14_3_um_filter_32_8]
MTKHFLVSKLLLSILSILIGIFYILSGIGKLINTVAFFNTLESYGLGNFSYLAPFICVGEILFGLLFLFQIRIKKAAFFSIITLSIFTIAFTYAHFFKGINDCGCFGEIGFLQSSYLISLIRNFVFILLSLTVYIYADKDTTPTPRWKTISIFCITILSSIIAGFTLNEPFITNEPFLNKPIQETPLSNYISTAKDSTYLIFVFSYNCSHCWNATENIKSYSENKLVDRIVGIAIKNNQKKNFYHDNLKPNFEILSTSSDSMGLIIKSVPTAFFVKNNIVTQVMTESIMSPFTFKEMYPNF